MLSFASIASGSNGNCYYVSDGEHAVLIDAGISCKETERRMARLGLKPESVNAIFISHEHADHVVGLRVLATKYQIPVFINPHTLRGCKFKLPPHLICSLPSFDPVCIGDLEIVAFPKSHDAADPVSFVVEKKGYRVGVFTDIGFACEQVKSFLPLCNAVFLESNYCDDMLATSRYPYILKSRISSARGHLSNADAFSLLQQAAGKQLSHIIFSHLSANNNHPDRVAELISGLLPHYTTHIASRSEESPIFSLVP